MTAIPGVALAASSWEQSAFPNWSSDLIDKLLTDSPWARPLTVAFELRDQDLAPSSSPRLTQIGLPGGLQWPGGRQRRTSGPQSVRTEVYLTVRWSSALPIRQALALQRFGRDGLGSEGAKEMLAIPEEHLIEIFGIPATLAPAGPRRLEAEFAKTARITATPGALSRSSSAHMPGVGMHLSAALRFPRLTASEDATRLEFSAEAGPLKIRQPFKPSEMRYGGRLEI